MARGRDDSIPRRREEIGRLLEKKAAAAGGETEKFRGDPGR